MSLLLSTVLLCATAACGQEPAAPATKIRVTLVVILAGEEGTEVDPKLTQIVDEVRKRNPQLKSFRIKSMMSRQLAENEKSEFGLVEDKKAEVVVKHGADADNQVEVAITPPEQGEILYRTVCGKFLPIVTRYQTKARERLILAIRVEPCAEKK
jgi:hypothetical protein